MRPGIPVLSDQASGKIFQLLKTEDDGIVLTCGLCKDILHFGAKGGTKVFRVESQTLSVEPIENPDQEAHARVRVSSETGSSCLGCRMRVNSAGRSMKNMTQPHVASVLPNSKRRYVQWS